MSGRFIRVTGVLHVTSAFETDSPRAAIRSFLRQRPHATQVEAEGLTLVGICDGCRCIILDCDEYLTCEDAKLCATCSPQDGESVDVVTIDHPEFERPAVAVSKPTKTEQKGES